MEIILLKKALLIAVCTSFVYALGFVPIFMLPFIPVPIVMQNMGVFLLGSILGPQGAVSMLLFLLLAALGFPVLAGGRGGLMVFVSPTAGFLLGYFVVTLLIGILVRWAWQKINWGGFISINLFGLLVLYGIGLPIASWLTEVSLVQVLWASLVFIPFDVIKVVLASYIATLFKQYYPLVK